MVKALLFVTLAVCISYTLAFQNVTMVYLQKFYTDSNILILDVREQDEYTQEHIPGAKNLPLSVLDDNLVYVPSDIDLYVHCWSGFRSNQASIKLENYGLKRVYNVADGFKAWTGPTEKIPEPYYQVANNDDLLQHYLDKNAYVIDIRSPAEYASCHVPGAVNIDFKTNNFKNVPFLKDVYVYGTDIYAYTHLSAQTIVKAGHTDVFAIEGSMNDWRGPVQGQCF